MASGVTVESCTSVGRVRTSNQDWLGYFQPPGDRPATGSLLVLADGMGGEAGGEVASRLAVEAVGRTYFEDPSAEPAAALQRALAAANEAIHARAAASPELHGMGTTCTALVLTGGGAWIAHVGDSRAYHVRRGRLQQLTSDHSLASRGPAYAHVLTRALGVQPDIEIDVVPVVSVRAGDVFLLCSDGLWGQVSDAEMATVLAAERDLQAVGRRLVDMANTRGGPDNISVILARVDSQDNGSWTTRLGRGIRRVWRHDRPDGGAG